MPFGRARNIFWWKEKPRTRRDHQNWGRTTICEIYNLHQRLLVLHYMLNLPQIFKDSSIAQQHAIINEVFKRGLTFKNGAFRTPWINPESESNLLDIKEKRAALFGATL